MARQQVVGAWMNVLEKWFAQLPSLPSEWKNVIVQIAPWVSLIGGIIGLILGLGGFTFFTMFSPFLMVTGGVGNAATNLIHTGLFFVASAFLVAAFSGVNKRVQRGWMLLFWSELLSLVGFLISSSLFGICVSLVGFYLLFQIKSYYK